MRTLDLIPNGILDLPVERDVVLACNDCAVRIDINNPNYCELRSFDATKAPAERSKMLGVACLGCVERREREALQNASKSNARFSGYVDGRGFTVHGVRLICDGKGAPLLTVLSTKDPIRLASGDTVTSIRARDAVGRVWHGRVRSLGYGSQYVSLKPCKVAS